MQRTVGMRGHPERTAHSVLCMAVVGHICPREGWLETGTRGKTRCEATDFCLLLDFIGNGLRKWDQRTKEIKIWLKCGGKRGGKK